MQSSPISQPNRLKPQSNVQPHHPHRTDRSDHRSSRHSNHSAQNGHSVNSKEHRNGSTNGCSGGVRSIKVCGNKEFDTMSDKQNENTWFITNERSYYDSTEIPVVPLFTHTNSVDFHKNNSPNHESIMNYTNCIYPNGNTTATTKISSKPSRKNEMCDEGKNTWFLCIKFPRSEYHIPHCSPYFY